MTTIKEEDEAIVIVLTGLTKEEMKAEIIRFQNKIKEPNLLKSPPLVIPEATQTKIYFFPSSSANVEVIKILLGM